MGSLTSVGAARADAVGRGSGWKRAGLASLSALLLTAVAAAPAQADRKSKFNLQEATIDEIQEAFDDRDLTCVTLTKLYLARIATYEDGAIKLNSVTTVNPKALQEAAALDRERRRHGPRSNLHCIPVLLKDNVDTFDMPTSNGSVILKDSVPPDDAFIAASLRRKGALILGKASMGEFAGGSYNTIDGQVVNPYNLKRQTGGSSAGSGAALAANIGVLAIGTDTSTSVRGPASFNGIVGLRPTTGLISRDGIAPKNLEFDSAGPMARTVTDTAEMLSVVAARDDADPLNAQIWSNLPPDLRRKVNRRTGTIDYTKFLKKRSLKGVRLGAVRDFFGGDPEIDALAEQALDVMRARGAEIVDITLDPAFLAFYVTGGGTNIRRIADYRFKADWEQYLATLSPDVPKTVAEFIRIYETEVNQSPLPVEASVMGLLTRSLMTSVDDPAYRNLVENLLPAATAYKLSLFEDHDLDALVFPYQTSFASPISNPVFSIPDPTFLRSTRPQPAIFAGYSSVGFPGIVVPMGFGAQGLPMTISLMGKPYSEGDLIGMAYDYEQASKMRAPSPLAPPLPGEVVDDD